MSTVLKPYTIQQFETMRTSSTLEINPEIQRRPVWPLQSKMLLIDSIARGVPIGAITLYENTEEGYSIYEVIDGKQRLRTILEYVDGAFPLDSGKVAHAEEDEIAEVGRELSEPFYDKYYGDLSQPERMRLLQYELPVFVVSGSRSQAVQAFTRMNRNSYVLKPQEIRNAVYTQSNFLAKSKAISEEFLVGDAAELGFTKMGIVTESAWERMQDIQFASELLALALEGVQHRRDTLDSFYDKYKDPSGAAAVQIAQAAKKVADVLSQVADIFDDGAPLAAYHFPRPCENDVYALVGALLERGTFSQAVMKQSQEEIRDGLSEFRRQVKLYVAAAREGTVTDDVPQVVASYGKTFLGGQQNSKTKRLARQAALIEVLDGLADAPQSKGFSPAIRELIWASSAEKVCARCGNPVQFEDFHAGHIKPKAKGGLPILSNGQIEHKACNQSAGAS